MATYNGTNGANRYVGPRNEANTINGFGGDDSLYGGDLGDIIVGGSGSDLLVAGAGNDAVLTFGDPNVSSSDRNTVRLGAGDDVALAGGEIDLIDGGTGFDFVDYLDSQAGVSVNLQTGRGLAGDARGDTYTGVEGVFGSTLNDTLVGSGADDILDGVDGADRLAGGAGNDLLFGGEGADRLTGGAGLDDFVFETLRDSTVAAGGRDLVTDFSLADDLLDVASIDANAARAGDQAFTFIDERAFTGVAGQLRFAQVGGDTVVYGDVNGDRRADFAVQLDGLLDLQATNFLL